LAVILSFHSKITPAAREGGAAVTEEIFPGFKFTEFSYVVSLLRPEIIRELNKLYPAAARWLERAKKAYHQKGQDAEWQAYIDNLRTTYARRPGLQKEIKGL